MNFKQFREFLSRGISKPADDFGEPDAREESEPLALAEVRSASRQERLTIKIKPEHLIKMILAAADEPERPWDSVSLYLTGDEYRSFHMASSLHLYGREGEMIEVNLSFAARTQPVMYAAAITDAASDGKAQRPEGSAER